MPTKAQTRREPQKGKNGFSANKGFTVIELMIALGVLAIIASLALPSYRSILDKREVTSGAEQFAAFFSTVKSVAVKRNEDIAMYPGKRTVAGEVEWCLGFKEFDETSCDCFADLGDTGACTVDRNNDDSHFNADGTPQTSELTVLRSTKLRHPETLDNIVFRQGLTAVNNKFFVFDSVRGALEVPDTDYADNMSLSFVVRDYALDLWIDRLGRTYVCSPSSSTLKVPGYKQC